ncbi:hypothetical protein M9Y10_001659 [Tritrichomonas musculus]|uniref:Sec23/Sec24 trunk domain containing protein n=1 Tax=Tritrichomonas musculus TaxID=1915356 RepID=A0ABR2LAL6_9EUKA
MSRRYIIPQMQDMSNNSAPPPATGGAQQQFSQNNLYPQAQAQYQQPQATPQREIIFPWANPKLQEPSLLPNQIPFPPYLRSVSGVFPANKSVADICKIPFGLVISPALVSDCPVVDCRQVGIVPRCNSCSSYLCPQVQITPQGNSWKCPLCGKINAIPPELITGAPAGNTPYYYPQAGINQTTQFFSSRLELQCPVYDVIAPKSYDHINAGPTFCFLVDMSYPALSIGFTQQMLASFKASLDSLQPHTRVGLMTMSNNLSIFDLVNSVEIVVPDLSEPVSRFNQDNLFPRIQDCKEQLNNAIDELLNRPINPLIKGHCIASALLLCEQTMINIGGIVIAGFVGLPQYGPYQLKPRQIENNDELPLLRLPTDGSGKIFRECAFKLNRASVSVHQFSAGQDFTDLSTVAVPAGLTCGQCNHYSIFDDFARSKMHSDIFSILTNQYCWDSCLRLRATGGCKMVRPHTNCTLRSGDLVSFPVIAREDAIAFELTATEQGITTQTIIFQLAMVYTNNEGNRMIRVFTIETPVSKDVRTICSSVDEATLTTMMCRRAGTTLLQLGPVQAVESIRKEIQAMVNQKALNFSSIYHLMHAMLSNESFRSRHPFGVDGRMSQIIMLRAISITNLLLYLYPRMFSVDTEAILPLTSSSFGQGTIFLFHTVDKIYIWVSAAADKNFLINGFGCQSLEDLPTAFPPGPPASPNSNSEEYLKLQKLISNCYELSGKYLPVEVIGQGSPREAIFSEIIVDDSTVCGSNLTSWTQSMRLSAQ